LKEWKYPTTLCLLITLLLGSLLEWVSILACETSFFRELSKSWNTLYWLIFYELVSQRNINITFTNLCKIISSISIIYYRKL
jgi:hypothetical protein